VIQTEACSAFRLAEYAEKDLCREKL